MDGVEISKAHSTFIVLIKSLLLINSLSLYRLQVNYNGLIQCDFEPTIELVPNTIKRIRLETFLVSRQTVWKWSFRLHHKLESCMPRDILILVSISMPASVNFLTKLTAWAIYIWSSSNHCIHQLPYKTWLRDVVHITSIFSSCILVYT